VACIEFRSGVGDEDAGSPTSLLEGALQRIRSAVRPEDRVCPLSTSTLAVEFGPVANAVPPEVLGYRLAQALGQDMPTDAPPTRVAVSVGMAALREAREPPDLTRRAMAAAQAGNSLLARRPFAGTQSSNTLVTVDRPVRWRWTTASHHQSALRSLHRRDVYRYRVGTAPSAPPSLPVILPSSDLSAGATDSESSLTVLVIEPAAHRSDDLGFAATTATTVAGHLGHRSAAVVMAKEDEPAMAVDGFPLDLVVLVLDGGWAGPSTTWANGAWGIPARLAATYRAANVPVLAVSAGAGAGAVASCVAQGALAVFSLDHLPDALRSLPRYPGEEFVPIPEMAVPPQFRALVSLTASERRILFYLTEGWAAQDIADQLVVSLTTVRSHIRSTLRKLGVRSQLAAVAIANSRDLEHALSGNAS
jgi:DNA-binding CsgD family transcriptional regulator